MGFVNVQVTTSSAQLVSEALERLTALMEAKYPGWEPNPNDILTIAYEGLGPLASDVAGIAAVPPEAIFRRFGTKLEGIEYNEGAPATVTALFTLSDELGHTIPQGTQVAVGNYGFYVKEAVKVEAGHTTGKVVLVAESVGTEYDGLTGAAELIEEIDWVQEVTLEGESSGGSNPETDSEYQDRLTAELALQAPRPVNAADFAPFLLGAPTSLGVKVGRAVSKDLYDAETSEENVPYCCTTWATGPEGEALTAEDYETLETWLRGYLPINFLAFVRAPVYEKIYVSTTIHVQEGYDPETVAAAVKTAIETLISKKNWGRQAAATTGSQQWVLETKLRYNVVLAAIGDIPGVQYVLDGAEGLAIGTAPAPTETADITLSGGPVVLPEATAGTISVTVK